MVFFKARVDVEKAGMREVVPLWEYDIEAENSQGQLTYNHLPEITPVFSKLLVSGSLTDVLEDGGAIGGTGFIVSSTLRDILLKFNLGKHNFYPLESFDYTTKKRIDKQYFWFQIIDIDFYTLIDYEQSIFVLFDDLEEDVISTLKIHTPGGLMAAVESTNEKDNSILYTKIYLNNLYKKNPVDVFYMNGISDNIFSYPIFSEKLKDELEKYSISGLEFKKVPIN